MNDSIARGMPSGRLLTPMGILASLWWMLSWMLRTPKVRWSLVFVVCTFMVVATAWWRLPGALSLFVALTLLVGLPAFRQLGR